MVPLSGLLVFQAIASSSAPEVLPAEVKVLAAMLGVLILMATLSLTSWLVRESGVFSRKIMRLALLMYQLETLLGVMMTLWAKDFRYFLIFGTGSLVAMGAVPVAEP